MIGIIVTGHGMFASGLISAAELLIGDVPLIGLDFTEKSANKLAEELNQSLEKFTNSDSIFILCDLVGGTPFRTMVTGIRDRKNVRVLYGANLNMLIELCMYGLESPMPEIDKIVQHVVCTCRDQVGVFDLNEKR